MKQEVEQDAWIESHDGSRYPIQGSCSFGRSRSNNVVLPEERVSRRHAIVHAQERNEFWIIDLGSSNGTFLNGRRVTQPCQLKDGDRIHIGGHDFAFHQEAETGHSEAEQTTQATIEHIRSMKCWLLLADIEASTQMARKLPPEEGGRITGEWLADCKRIVDAHQGSINKFLGDGFLAYWVEGGDMVRNVVAGLETLRSMQATSPVAFRLVLHYGTVFVRGGAGSLGEDNLFGMEVNFIFRMEKQAGTAGTSCMMSEAARETLKHLLPTQDCGRLPVPSFEGDFQFYAFDSVHPQG